MKTKLYSMPDWKAALNTLGWADAPADQTVEETVRQELTRGRVSFQERPAGSPITAGNRVTIQTRSVLPRFNRDKTVLTVGTGLFDASIEQALPGLAAGDSGTAVARGEAVSFTVLKVEEKVYPELSDELVQALRLEGIDNLAAYRDHMTRKLRLAYAKGLMERLLQKILPEAQLDAPAEEDITAILDLEYAPLNTRFHLDAMSAAEWTEAFGKEELRQFYLQIYPAVGLLFGTTGKDSYYASRRDSAIETLRVCLLLRAILGDDSTETDPTQTAGARASLEQTMEERLCAAIYGG